MTQTTIDTIKLPRLSDAPLHSGAELIEVVRRRAIRMRHLVPGVVGYTSLADYLMDHGVLQFGDPRPASVVQMEMGKCISNAISAAQWHPDYLYCEGYAGPYAVHHAWLYDPRHDRVIDPTWSGAEHCIYFGAMFCKPVFTDYGPQEQRAVTAYMRDLSLTQNGFYTPALYFLAGRPRCDIALGPWVVRHRQRAGLQENDR